MQVWIDPKGEQLAFGKLKGTIVGGLYDVKVEREADGAFKSASSARSGPAAHRRRGADGADHRGPPARRAGDGHGKGPGSPASRRPRPS